MLLFRRMPVGQVVNGILGVGLAVPTHTGVCVLSVEGRRLSSTSYAPALPDGAGSLLQAGGAPTAAR
ncbi:hypothetical protein C3R36_09850 [Mycobacterium tuberculosis]|nr:hypothetical protein C3R36_09850 [Mycobacterium tuberculosis]